MPRDSRPNDDWAWSDVPARPQSGPGADPTPPTSRFQWVPAPDWTDAGSGRQATGGWEQPSWVHESPTSRGGRGWVIAAAVLVALVVVGGLGWFLLGSRTDDGKTTAAPELAGGGSAAPGWSTPPSSEQAAAQAPAAQAPVQQAPDQQGQSQQSGTGDYGRQSSAPIRDGGEGFTTTEGRGSSSSYPSGADRSGWTSPSGARCNAGDPASIIAQTSTSKISICTNPDNGRYYYRGYSGGDSLEVDDPSVYSGGASVTNKNVTYKISSSGVTIYQNGSVISSQPIVSFWQK